MLRFLHSVHCWNCLLTNTECFSDWYRMCLWIGFIITGEGFSFLPEGDVSNFSVPSVPLRPPVSVTTSNSRNISVHFFHDTSHKSDIRKIYCYWSSAKDRHGTDPFRVYFYVLLINGNWLLCCIHIFTSNFFNENTFHVVSTFYHIHFLSEI